MDLNKLSYNAYGNIMIITLVGIAILFNLFPFTLIKFITCLLQIPIYLIVRSKFEEPIHAVGLNICFILTTTFYILLYGVIELLFIVISMEATFIISSIICILSCYATSTLPQKQHNKGKLFFGRKAENGKYKPLYDFMRFNPYDERLVKYENDLKANDTFRYTIFKSIFRDFNTWEATMEIIDIYDLKKLDRELYSIYKTLEYVLGLDKID